MKGTFSRIIGGIGRYAGREYHKVGSALRKHDTAPLRLRGIIGPEHNWYAYAEPTTSTILDNIERDVRGLTRGAASRITGAPVARGGRWAWNHLGRTDETTKETVSRLFSPARRVAGNMRAHPYAWTAGLGAAGFGVGMMRGIRQGMQESGYPVETRNMEPTFGSGPGYMTWAKGRGRPMSPNHLGTAGLTQALHTTRHR